MQTSASTAMPVLATMAAAGWLAWSHLGSSPPPPPPKKAAGVTIETSWLNPPIGEPPARDPFRPPGAKRSAGTSARLAGATTESARPGRKRGGEGVPGRPARVRVVAPRSLGAASNGIAAERDAAKWAKEVPEDFSGRVRLSATTIRGARRMAVINDRMVVEGEAIPNLGAAGEPVVLFRVDATSVVLRHRGASSVVTFPSIATATAAPPASHAATRPAAPRSGASKSGQRAERRPSGSRRP